MAALDFVDLNHCGLGPLCGDLASGKDSVVESGKLCEAGFIHPFVCLSWDVIWTWGFVVFNFAQDFLEFKDGDRLHGDWAVGVDGVSAACVWVGGGTPVAA